MQKMSETQVPSLGWKDSPGGGHGNPLQCSCLENPMDRGAWQATVHRVAKGRTQLKQLHTCILCPFYRWKKWASQSIMPCWESDDKFIVASVEFFLVFVEELIHLKRPWCWERLKVGEGDDRGWVGSVASLTQWTWVWVNFGSWCWTGRSGVPQSMGSQRVWHYWATELNLWKEWNLKQILHKCMCWESEFYSF